MKTRTKTLLLAAWVSLTASASSEIVETRTLGLVNPIGIESTPRFSWKVKSDQRGYRQQAYEITVSESGGSTVWTSGKVSSTRQVGVRYEGPALKSRTQYEWQVVAYDTSGQASTTGTGTFETALLDEAEWTTANWIAAKAPSCKAKVEIVPEGGMKQARYLKLDVQSSGPHAAADPNYGFVQLAELEIYDAEGTNVARTATFTATSSWELTNYGWSIDYLHDGVVSGGSTNGFTTPQNVTATTIVADLGAVTDVTRIILYPRQDAAAVGNTEQAANFPSTYTLSAATSDGDYSPIYETKDAQPPTYTNDTNIPYLGRTFTIDSTQKVVAARLYASAIGVFTMRLNGKPVTDNVLEPGESAFDKHVLYSTYDVTQLLAEGRNTLLAQVAGGIANMSTMSDRFVKPELASNTATTSLRALLYVTFEDGTELCVPTDEAWGTHASPTTGSNWYGGEDYDARLLPSDIYATGYDVSTWEQCMVVQPTFCAPSVSANTLSVGQMRAREYEPLRVVESWTAVSVTRNASGNYLVDFGQNFAGTYSFTLKAPAGTKITLYDSELQDNGACKFEYMYQPNGASNRTLDTYVFRGDEKGETWGPEFMYHGFRYLEISGLEEAPAPEAFTAKRIRCAMDVAGSFHTSNTLLNDIHTICYRGMESQLYNTVTDCPHREKLGWLDVPNLMYQSLSYNFDVKSLLAKVVMDAFDSQGANHYVPSTVPHFMRAYDDDLNWGGAAITIPWRHYKMYGDADLMTQYYDQMASLIDYYSSLADNHIIRNYSVLSDWGQETSGLAQPTSSPFTLTCTYYYLLNAMAEVAQALGHSTDADRWTAEAAEVKKAFNARFFSNGVYEYGNQANYGMALYYGLVDDADVPAVAQALATAVKESGYCIKTGEVGLRPTLMSLAEHGYNDVVYRMANKTTYPSYGYWIKQGATTSLEYWDMSLSQNHCMMDHIEEWFFSQLGGISDAGNGYETVRIAPWIPADMAEADIATMTPRGSVGMAWQRTSQTTTYRLSVPAGAKALVTLPIIGNKQLKEGRVALEDVEGVSDVQHADTLVTFTLGSGDYEFFLDGSTLEEPQEDPDKPRGEDVTALYLLNPGFEEKDTNVVPWAPTHWTLSFPDTDGNWGALSTSDQRSVNPTEGKYDWHIWYNNDYVSVRLSQAVSLPAGDYDLYGDLRCVDNQAITGSQRLFAVVGTQQNADTVYSEPYNNDQTVNINVKDNENLQNWRTLCLTFSLPEEETVTLGYDCPKADGAATMGGFQADNMRLFIVKTGTGVTKPEMPENQPVRFYTLTGMQVPSPQAGQPVIRFQGGKGIKILPR